MNVSAIERRLTVVAVVVPFAGFIAALVLLWGDAASTRDLAIMAVMYVITGFGITIGYHRLLTHRAFEAPTAVRAAFAIAGSMAVQGSAIHWVSDHRKHHTFADEDGDPHSPHTHRSTGLRGVLEGIWHSHVGWLLDRDKRRPERERYAPDLMSQPVMRFLDRAFPALILLGLAIPFAAGWAIGGTLTAGLTGLLWGGAVRIFLLHHATWSVNSVCHLYGTRPFEIDDQSRNNWAVAIVALGEGWHHNHHAFPTSAKQGLRRWQLDPSWLIIRSLALVGLARNLRLPTPAQLARKLPKPQAGAGTGAPEAPGRLAAPAQPAGTS
jgi:stearoyl-CoA desaturase (delta-9 desaturase)